mgnify:FL=1
MKDCIFCKIVAGEIPSYKIYEDKKYLVFLDISQATDGHMLLIPKKHFRYVWDIEKGGEFFELAQKLAKHIQKISGSESVMSLTIGEMVPHAHLHLIPDTRGNRKLVLNTWSEVLETRKLVAEEMMKIQNEYAML